MNPVTAFPALSIAWLSSWLGRRRWWLCLTGVLITALLWGPARRLQLDESIESFFAPTDPLIKNYLSSRETFGGDEFVLVAYQVEAPPDQPDRDNPTHNIHLNAMETFADQLSQIPGVNADSTQHLKKIFRPAGFKLPEAFSGYVTRRLLDGGLREQAEGILLGSDNRTVAIVLRLIPEGQTTVPRRETIRQIREVAATHRQSTVIGGEPVQVHDMFRYVEHDSLVMGVASTLLLAVIIVMMFRSLRWTLLPLLVVQPALLWTCGILAIFGGRLSMVSSMLTSLTTIIGVTVVMHVAVMYREARLTLDRQAAFARVMQQLSRPIFWNLATTAIGFGSLMTSSISPVRSFGLMMLLSTGLIAVTSLMFLPAGILVGRRDTDPHAGGSAEQGTMRGLQWLFDAVVHHRIKMLAGLALLTALAAWGLRYVQVETDFSRNFRQGSPVLVALDYFETRFGGVGTWEVNFPAPRDLDDDYVSRVRRLAAELRTLRQIDATGQRGELTKVVAFSDGVDFVPGLNLVDQRKLLHDMQPEWEPSLYNQEKGRMRIILRSRERQRAEGKLALIDEVRATSRRHFPEAEVTGLYVLLANLIQSLLRDQLTSFALSMILIVACVWAAFRRLSWSLIAMLPNILPTLWLVGGLSWCGIPINIGTAMITSVSLGLTIDSSIHYLAGYREALARGLSCRAALQESSTHVGQVLVFTNVALIVGFSVLAASNFLPLVSFGLLVSLAMFFGLLGNLIVLPALLLWTEEFHTVPGQ